MKRYRLTWTEEHTGKTGHGDWTDDKDKVEREKRSLERAAGNYLYQIEEKSIYWQKFWNKYRCFFPERLRDRTYIYYLTPEDRGKIGASSTIRKCPNCFKKHVLVALPSGKTGCVSCKVIAKLKSLPRTLPGMRIVKNETEKDHEEYEEQQVEFMSRALRNDWG